MNFLTLYHQAVGRTEVPPQFHTWVALSLIAACLENRVWFARMAYQRIYPNLYVFLIGDAACGKGTAIGLGKRILDEMDKMGSGINYFRGSVTRAAMQDELAERWDAAWKEFARPKDADEFSEEPERVSLFTLAPELSSNIGTGAIAKDLIKFLTDLWEGDTGKYIGRTRHDGVKSFVNPCLNLLVGSAPEWCREVVDVKDLASGFWSRVVCVRGERDHTLRIARPDTRQWDILMPTLAWRLMFLLRKIHHEDLEFRGAMTLSPAAEARDIQWYETREKPEDALFAAHWARQPELIIRIAMLLRFCDFWDLHNPGESWRMIGLRHWEQALRLSEILLTNATTFLGESLTFTNNNAVGRVEEAIKRAQHIRKIPELLRAVSRYGVKARDLEFAIQALEDEKKVERTAGVKAGDWDIHWRG